MAMEIQPHHANEIQFDRNWIEEIILNLADAFHIRIVWDRNAAVLTGVFAIAGGLVGGYAGGRMGAALGSGIGGVTGFGMSTVISLREIWTNVKEKLKELFFIVFNFLRRLDPVDYVNGFEILMASYKSRRELVLTILEFIAIRLGREVLSNLTALDSR